MCFGEATMHTCPDFNLSKYLMHANVLFSDDLDSCPKFARLCLCSAKTTKPAEVQDVFLTPQGSLCALAALKNLGEVILASVTDPLFSW